MMRRTVVSNVVRYPRDYFLDEVWDHNPGEHVTIIAPTGGGKTQLGYELLARSTSHEHPGIVLCMKPRDATVESWNSELGYRKVKTWPPTPSLVYPKPTGYTLWPQHTFDPDRDEAHLYHQMRAALLHSYRKGNRAVFADELYGLTNDLDLEKELITVWSRGRSMGTSIWGATQKPTHVPLWAYNQAEHLFLAYDPDKRARDRFKEIGGVDPRLVEQAVMSLKKWEFLYIKRDGPHMCIIESS